MSKKAINALANMCLFAIFAVIFACAIHSFGHAVFGDYALLVLFGWIASAVAVIALMFRSFGKRWEKGDFLADDPRRW